MFNDMHAQTHAVQPKSVPETFIYRKTLDATFRRLITFR